MTSDSFILPLEIYKLILLTSFSNLNNNPKVKRTEMNNDEKVYLCKSYRHANIVAFCRKSISIVTVDLP